MCLLMKHNRPQPPPMTANDMDHIEGAHDAAIWDLVSECEESDDVATREQLATVLPWLFPARGNA